MTRISVPGNEGGFALLDALICLFTVALLLLILSGAVSGALGSSFKALRSGEALIEERNSVTAQLMEGGEHER